MSDIMHFIKIQASPEQSIRHSRRPKAFATGGRATPSSIPGSAGRGVFRFYGGSDVTEVRIDELDPAARVGWTTISSNAPGEWDAPLLSRGLDVMSKY